MGVIWQYPSPLCNKFYWVTWYQQKMILHLIHYQTPKINDIQTKLMSLHIIYYQILQ